ncbi:MAG: hypothetical protein ACK5Y2_00715 [Bdellovibrionales bacterium]
MQKRNLVQIVFWVGAILSSIPVFTRLSHAAIIDELNECTRTCSVTCLDLARQAHATLEKFRINCGSLDVGTGESEIRRSCLDNFTATADEQRCLRSAQSGSTVRACVDSFVSTADELQCIERAQSVEVVRACTETYISSVDELSCLQGAASPEIVRACSEGFLEARDEIECARSAKSVPMVRLCTESFVNPAEELNCLKQNKEPQTPGESVTR